jgi:serine/threonine protein kinase
VPLSVPDSPQRHEEAVGRYEILRPLAVGGMARLHLARFRSIEGFEKLAVIKRLRHEHADNGELVEMFLSEARLLANMQHPNIVHVYDVGSEAGAYYYAMEYLEGQDLRRVLRKVQGQLPLDQALIVVTSALAGLHYVHERRGGDGTPLGIVHRDVSPANIFVTYDGTPKILDLGVAKVDSTHRTRAGVLKGKVRYMAPEQVAGKKIDRRCDVFAAGIVLWELTLGRRLFDGTDVEVILQIANDPIPPPSAFSSDYPTDLERIVMRALERDPDARYQTAREMQQELESFAREAKLTLSASGLEAFMSQTFEDEIRLAEAQKSDSPPSAVVPGPRLRESVSQSGIVPGSRSGEEGATKPLPEPRRGGARWLLLGAAGLASIAVGIGGARWLAARRASQVTPSQAAGLPTPAVSEASSAAPPAATPTSDPTADVSATPSDPPKWHAVVPPRIAWPRPRPAAPAPPPRAVPSDGEGRPPASAPPPRVTPNCNPPYTVDTNGIEHFKPGCL